MKPACRRPAGHDFDGMARWYDLGIRLTVGFSGAEVRLRRTLVSLLCRAGLEDGARVLEVGVGTGSNLKAMEDVCPSCSLTGLDLSLPMLRRAAAKRFARPPFLLRGDAARLPLPDESYDAALAVFTLHELPADVREQAAAEMHRVLRPGGLLLVADFSRPRGGWGGAAFRLFGLFESREMLEFAEGGAGLLFGRFPFDAEAPVPFLGGMVTASLFRKRGAPVSPPG